MWEKYTASALFRPMAFQRRSPSNRRPRMNITAFRHLSVPSKILPALIAVGVNAIFSWGAVRASSVLPPERVSRMPAAAVDSRDRTGRRDLMKGSEGEKCRESDTREIERGRYLVKISGCNDCHTAGYAAAGGEIPESQWLLGNTLGWRGPWGTKDPAHLRLF